MGTKKVGYIDFGSRLTNTKHSKLKWKVKGERVPGMSISSLQASLWSLPLIRDSKDDRDTLVAKRWQVLRRIVSKGCNWRIQLGQIQVWTFFGVLHLYFGDTLLRWGISCIPRSNLPRICIGYGRTYFPKEVLIRIQFESKCSHIPEFCIHWSKYGKCKWLQNSL